MFDLFNMFKNNNNGNTSQVKVDPFDAFNKPQNTTLPTPQRGSVVHNDKIDPFDVFSGNDNVYTQRGALIKGSNFGMAQQGYDVPENNPYRQVNNSIQGLQAVGMNVPQRKPSGLINGLMAALDVVNRPGYAVRNMIKDTMDKDDDTAKDVLMHGWQGLTGKLKTNTTDLYDEAGWKAEVDPNTGKNVKWYKSLNNATRNITGFIGDVALDPVTYLSAGTNTFAKSTGKGAGLITKGSVDDIIKNAVDNGALKGLTLKAGETEKDAIVRMLGDVNGNVNAATVKSFVDSVSEGADATTTAYNLAKKERINYMRKELGTKLGVDTKKGNGVNFADLSADNLEKLYGDLSTASKTKAISKLDKYDIVKSLTDDIDPFKAGRTFADDAAKLNAEEAYFKTIDTLNRLNGRQLRMTHAVKNAFGSEITAVKAAGVGRKLGKAPIQTKLGELFTKGATEVEHLRAAEGKQVEIQLANGLSQIYDDVTGQMYLKFMGKDIMNVTKTFGKPIANGVDKIMNFNPISKVADSLGGIFKTRYVSSTVRQNNPEVAGQIKGFMEELKGYIQKETGLPKHALDTVLSAYGGEDMEKLMRSEKLRGAVFDFIERDIDDGGAKKVGKNYAASAWEKTAATLTPEELKLVEEAAARHVTLMSAIQKWDSGFKDYDVLDNYVKHYYNKPQSEITDIMSAMSAKQRIASKTKQSMGEDLKRVFKSGAAAEELSKGKFKVKRDILAVDAMRYMDSMRGNLSSQLAGRFEQLASTSDIISKNRVKGYVEIRVGKNNYYVHTDVAREMKRFTDIFVDDVEFNRMLGFFDNVTGMMKQLQTSWNPAFTPRNFLGETMMNYVAGVGLKPHLLSKNILSDAGQHKIARVGNQLFLNDGKEFKQIADLITEKTVSSEGVPTTHYYIDFMNGTKGDTFGNVDVPLVRGAETYEDYVTQLMKKNGSKTFNIGGKEYTSDQLLQNFYDLGLGWSGITRGNVDKNMSATLKENIRTTTKIGQLNPLDRLKNAGDYTETFTRMAHWIDRMEKGYSPQEAAMDVRKYHVDYRDLTPIERNIFRRVMPYYTYMRKNLPIQLHALVTQPGKFAMLGKLVDSSYRALQLDPNMTPDYLRESLALPMYEDDDGNTVYLNWNLPVTDLARLKADIGEAWQTNVMDMLHPAIKAPFEIATNTNIGLGSPIETYEGQRTQIIPGVGAKVIPKKVDYAMQQLGVLQTTRKTIGEVLSPDDPMKPDAPVPFLGSLIKAINPVQTSRANAYQYAEQLNAMKNRLREQGIEVPDGNDLKKAYKAKVKNGYKNTSNNPWGL